MSRPVNRRHRSPQEMRELKEDSSPSSSTGEEAIHQIYDSTATRDQEGSLSAPERSSDGLVKIDSSIGSDGGAFGSNGPNGTTNSGTTTTSSNDRWLAIAGMAGCIAEWFDFAIFGWLSDILGIVFFPPTNENDRLSGTSKAFLVFSVAFWMRPIGGIVMGHIGDTRSRRGALIVSILLMALPTFLMGCLPGYSLIGSWAIVLLVLVRLMQGLSVGGQLMSSLVFTLENQDPARWGLHGSFVMVAANVGSLIGGITSFVLRGTLTHEQLVAWGWRIPFLAGISISYAAYYLKAHGSDDTKHGLHSTGRSDDVMTEYQAGDDPDDVVVHSAVPVTNPLREAFSRGNLRSLLAATLVPMLFASGFYFSFVWMAIYMSKLIEHPVPGAHALNAAALFLSVCLVFPVAGALSDRFGRVRVMTIGALGMGIFTPLLLQCIRQGEPGLAFIAQCTMGVLLSTYSAPMCAWLVEAFEPGARLTSVAIGYNFAQAIAGGSTPFVATYMVDNVGSSSPGWILTFVSMASLIGLRCVAPAAPKVMFDSLSLRGSKDDKFEMTDTVVPTPESNERVDDKPSAELL